MDTNIPGIEKQINVFKQFCKFFETFSLDDKRAYLQAFRTELLVIYSCGLTLPGDASLSDVEYENVVTAESIKNRLLAISGLIAEHRFYWEVFDPTNHLDTEAVCGDLIDDIGDIYKDIKKAVLTYETGTEAAKQDAAWQLHFGFHHHWGDHCIDALRACHYILDKAE